MPRVSPARGGEVSGPCPPFYTSRPAIKLEPSLKASDLHKDHDSRMAVIVGSGPSLKDFDFSQLDRPWVYTLAINEEMFRNQDEYRADSWIFFDSGVADKHRKDDIPDGVEIFTRGPILQHLISKSAWPGNPFPDWAHRVRSFETGHPWRPDMGRLYMSKTTATAALTQAVLMGFKHIALLGVDCYTRQDLYYYDGQVPSVRRKRSGRQLDESRYMEDRHVRMITDMTHVAQKLRQMEWPGQVYQCSLESPCAPFGVDCKVPWAAAVHRYGR